MDSLLVGIVFIIDGPRGGFRVGFTQDQVAPPRPPRAGIMDGPLLGSPRTEGGAGCLIEGGPRSARGPVGILIGEPWLDISPEGGLRCEAEPAVKGALPLRPCSSTAFLTDGFVDSEEPGVDGIND